MAVINFDMSLDEGEALIQQWTWWNGPDNSAQVAVDLTGCTAEMFVWLDPTVDEEPLAHITTTSVGEGVITLGGSAGTIAVDVNRTTMSGMPLNRLAFGLYKYFLFITFPGPFDPICFSEGQITKKASGTP